MRGARLARGRADISATVVLRAELADDLHGGHQFNPPHAREARMKRGPALRMWMSSPSATGAAVLWSINIFPSCLPPAEVTVREAQGIAAHTVAPSNADRVQHES